MAENIERRSRWSAPILDRHEDLIIAQRQAGASLREVQKSLRQRKTRASISTISRFIKSLPEERFQRTSQQAPTPPGKQRSSAAHYAIRSNGSRQKQPDRELPLANQKENFRRREAAQQAKYWVNRGLALGKARHGNHRDGLIHSIGTKRNYEGALTRFCRWIQQHKFRDLESVSIKNTMRYLEERSTQVGQKTLDLDRQAIQFLLRQTTGAEMRLERIKSTFTGGRKLAAESRAYTLDQVEAVCSRLSPRAALAARIAFAAGLRAHELFSIRPANELQASSHRSWSPDRFAGREGELFVVAGKGGLRREVMLPHALAAELKSQRFEDGAVAVRDRGINYQRHYDIAGGQSLSDVWNRASSKELGWSAGVHGLRHSYAQNRMTELGKLGYGREERKSIVSQELGHFRTTETETYLR